MWMNDVLEPVIKMASMSSRLGYSLFSTTSHLLMESESAGRRRDEAPEWRRAENTPP